MMMMLMMVMVTMWFSLGAQCGRASKSKPGGLCLSGSELWMGIGVVMTMVLMMCQKVFQEDGKTFISQPDIELFSRFEKKLIL